MIKEIKQHQAFMEDKLSQNLSSLESRELAKFHHRQIQHFQHERLIHLLVTLFFAGLTLTFAVISFCLWLLLMGSDLAAYFGLALFGLSLILDLFYIKHYYQLENGVQKLYKINHRLFEKTINDKK